MQDQSKKISNDQELIQSDPTSCPSVGLRSERSGVRNLPPPCCVLEQDTLLPKKYWLNTQEVVAPSRHDYKIVDWDVKPQYKQTNILPSKPKGK